MLSPNISNAKHWLGSLFGMEKLKLSSSFEFRNTDLSFTALGFALKIQTTADMLKISGTKRPKLLCFV